MSYVPRLTAPSSTDKYWISTDYGGYNECMHISGGSVLPNCVGYAWGRFMEILGSTPSLSTNDASSWYGHTSDGYSRGSQPQPGAVICWGGGSYDGAGHVGIVEAVNSDGSIVISASDYGGSRWYSCTLTPPDYYIYSGLYFQGFIYNPGYSAKPYKEVFLDEVYSHVGEGSNWTCQQTGLSANNDWAAAFISACTKSAGVDNVALSYSTSMSTMLQNSIDNGLGKFIEGPKYGNQTTPEPGDIVIIDSRTTDPNNTQKYLGETVGVVYSVSSTNIKTIRGSYNDKVTIVYYGLTDSQIAGYYRPDWSSVESSLGSSLSNGSTITSGTTQYVVGNLYDEVATKEDATVREVGYVDTSYEPSIKSSNIRLSVINYTTMLGAVFITIIRDTLGYTSSSITSGDLSDQSGTIISDSMDSAPKAILQFLTTKGLCAAAAVGIIANIERESDFRTDCVGDSGTSFGICQWHDARGDAMKNMAGSDWASDLTGQLEYLWYELNSGYKYSVLEPLLSVPNTEAGAQDAARTFCINFEIPADVYTRAEERAALASSYWSQLVIQSTST